MPVSLEPNTFLATLQSHHSLLQIIGTLGCLVYVGTYLLVQAGRLDGNSIHYSACKLFAASCVLTSLLTAFNLASFMIQVSFVTLSLYGIWYRLSGRINMRRDRSAAAGPLLQQVTRIAHPQGLADRDARYPAVMNLCGPWPQTQDITTDRGHPAAADGPGTAGIGGARP